MGFFDKLFKKQNIAQNTEPKLSNQQVTMTTANLGSLADKTKEITACRRGYVTTNKLVLSKDSISELKRRYIAFDIETTGLSPKSDKIIEVGAVIFENGNKVSRFESLINVKTPISSAASAVNHITNKMIAVAPDEKTVYKDLTDYFGNALNEQTVLCAHNATFDMSFLAETLMEMGYDGKILYVDTLSLARKVIDDLPNYKQDTVAEYFNISNQQSHRAVSDAAVCGEILYKLLESYVDEQERKSFFVEKSKPVSEEREICAYIQKIVIDNGGDIEYLGFYKNSSNYIDVTYMYSVIKFKIVKKGKYIITDKKVASTLELPIEQCTISEGGSDFVRVYFRSPFDLKALSSYIFDVYCKCRKSAKEYLNYNSRYRDELINSPSLLNAISMDEMNTLLEMAQARREEDKEVANTELCNFAPIIKRADVTINPLNSRVKLSEIKNLHDWSKGYDEGHYFWEQGDVLRKEGKLDEAISLFDKSRYYGYCAPVLFDSYAMAYHKQKDYDNEIDILEEGIKRGKEEGTNTSLLETRLEKAIQILFKQQQDAIQKKEKQDKAEKKKFESEIKKQSETSNSVKRPILKMNDDFIVIQRFESVADASRETGINSKSIRDAAKGIQKHAGNFVWKYADEIEIE